MHLHLISLRICVSYLSKHLQLSTCLVILATVKTCACELFCVFGVYLQHSRFAEPVSRPRSFPQVFLCASSRNTEHCMLLSYIQDQEFQKQPNSHQCVCVCFLSHSETCGRILAVQKDLRVPWQPTAFAMMRMRRLNS